MQPFKRLAFDLNYNKFLLKPRKLKQWTLKHQKWPRPKQLRLLQPSPRPRRKRLTLSRQSTLILLRLTKIQSSLRILTPLSEWPKTPLCASWSLSWWVDLSKEELSPSKHLACVCTRLLCLPQSRVTDLATSTRSTHCLSSRKVPPLPRLVLTRQPLRKWGLLLESRSSFQRNPWAPMKLDIRSPSLKASLTPPSLLERPLLEVSKRNKKLNGSRARFK